MRSDWLFWVANSFALLGGIDTARSWSGPIVGRRERAAPDADDCEPLSPLTRRLLPYVAHLDLPYMPWTEPPDPEP